MTVPLCCFPPPSRIAPLRTRTTVAEDTFETAADAVIEGRLTELQALLRDQPPLATALAAGAPCDPAALRGRERRRAVPPEVTAQRCGDRDHAARSPGGG